MNHKACIGWITGLCLLVPSMVLAIEAQQSALEYSSSQRNAARHASEWNLDSSEWTRYQSLMQGPRGLWSPELDPLYVLGIYARSDTERRRYAELVVQQEYERVEKELAFQREVNAAWKRLYGDVAMIDPARLGLGVERQSARKPAQSGQNVFLFVSAKDCTGCDTAVAQWQRMVRSDPATSLRIYLANADSRIEQLRWAKEHGLSELMASGRVVVQAEAGTLAKVMAGRAMPVLPYTIIR